MNLKIKGWVKGARQKNACSESIYMPFKNKENKTIVLKVSVGISFGKGAVIGRGIRWHLKLTFNFLS
jgi:hypothetical protein